MSKKSVVIALPPRVIADGPTGRREPDGWVPDMAGIEPGVQAATAGRSIIDLTQPRNVFELMWLVWSFPALATLHWMSNARTGSGTGRREP